MVQQVLRATSTKVGTIDGGEIVRSVAKISFIQKLKQECIALVLNDEINKYQLDSSVESMNMWYF